MRYVTTNLRLPEDLWRSLKIEAAEKGLRLSELVRSRLGFGRGTNKPSAAELRGLWKGAKIPENLFDEAKRSWLKGVRRD